MKLFIFILLLLANVASGADGVLTSTNGVTILGAGPSGGGPQLWGTNAVDGSITNSNFDLGIVKISSDGGSTLTIDPGAGIITASTYEIDAALFVGNGVNLTSLNASQLTSGTVPVSVIPILHSTLAGNVTSTSATFATTTLSVTLLAGTTYTYQAELFLSDSTAADGAKIDFNGGTATATTFIAQVTAFDTALNLSSQLAALNTAASASTFTGAGAFEVHGTIFVNAGGTFIPRFAQVNHTLGTLTLAKGSFIRFFQTP